MLCNLILFSQNNHIIVTVTPQLWNQFVNLLNEGGLYNITNIRVEQATGILRPVSSTKCISLMTSTIVTPLLDDDFIIPMHKFELVPLPILYGKVYEVENCGESLYSTGKTSSLFDIVIFIILFSL